MSKIFLQPSRLKFWYCLAHAHHCCRSGLETATLPLSPHFASCLLTVLVLTGVLCWVGLHLRYILFCLVSMLAWSSYGVVTLRLPGLALDENDMVCENLSRVHILPPTESFNLAAICLWDTFQHSAQFGYKLFQWALLIFLQTNEMEAHF